MNNEQLEREKNLENRFGFYREKTTEELENILDKLMIEKEEDEIIFERKYKTYAQRLDAHNDIIFLNEQIGFIENILSERNSKSR